MELLFLALVFRALDFWRMLSLRTMCSKVHFLFFFFNPGTGLLLRGHIFRLGIREEIGNVALVFFAIDWNYKIWRVVAHFAHFFGDGIALELALVGSQDGL